jgi:hypothetical protein
MLLILGQLSDLLPSIELTVPMGLEALTLRCEAQLVASRRETDLPALEEVGGLAVPHDERAELLLGPLIGPTKVGPYRSRQIVFRSAA